MPRMAKHVHYLVPFNQKDTIRQTEGLKSDQDNPKIGEIWVHVKFVGEVDAIILLIIPIYNGWSPFVTSTEAVWPSGEVCLQSRFLHFAPISVFDRRHGGYGRNDPDLSSFLSADFYQSILRSSPFAVLRRTGIAAAKDEQS